METKVPARPPPYANVAQKCDPSPPEASPVLVQMLSHTVHSKPNQHELTVSTDPSLDELLVIRVRSLYSGDIFERSIVASEVPSFTDPPQIHTVKQLAKMIQEGVMAEANEAPSDAVNCRSAEEEHADPNDKRYVFRFEIVTFFAGFSVVIEVPLKSAAALETRFDMKLANLEEAFSRQIGHMQQQLDLVKLQMNKRVFFGVKHSVHIESTRLMMIEHGGSLNISRSEAKSDQLSLLQLILPGDAAAKANGLYDEFNDIPAFSWPGVFLPPLSSQALLPLQLCRDLVFLSVQGPNITNLDFLAGLPKLQEVVVHNSQVRALEPLATLPNLTCLRLTNLNLEGGGDIDISCLEDSNTLMALDLMNSSSISNIAPLARVASLREIILINCVRITDRSAFVSNPGLKLVG